MCVFWVLKHTGGNPTDTNTNGENGPPPETNPNDIRELVRLLVQEFRGQGTPHAPPTAAEARMKLLERFQKLKPPEFTGTQGPKSASEWLVRMEDLWRTLLATEEEKVILIVGILRESARTWWDLECGHRADGMTWAVFRQLFEEEYYPEEYRDAKAVELLSMTQGEMTVEEYSRRFKELLELVPGAMPDLRIRARKFKVGLRPAIQRHLVGHGDADFRRTVALALEAEEMEASWKDYVKDKKADKTTSKRKAGTAFSEAGQTTSSRRPPLPPTSTGRDGGSDTARRTTKPECQECGRRHGGVCRWGSGACFRCGSMDHRVSQCPRGDRSEERIETRSEMSTARDRAPFERRCYLCDSPDHVMAQCPKRAEIQRQGRPTASTTGSVGRQTLAGSSGAGDASRMARPRAFALVTDGNTGGLRVVDKGNIV